MGRVRTDSRRRPRLLHVVLTLGAVLVLAALWSVVRAILRPAPPVRPAPVTPPPVAVEVPSPRARRGLHVVLAALAIIAIAAGAWQLANPRFPQTTAATHAIAVPRAAVAVSDVRAGIRTARARVTPERLGPPAAAKPPIKSPATVRRTPTAVQPVVAALNRTRVAQPRTPAVAARRIPGHPSHRSRPLTRAAGSTDVTGTTGSSDATSGTGTTGATADTTSVTGTTGSSDATGISGTTGASGSTDTTGTTGVSGTTASGAALQPEGIPGDWHIVLDSEFTGSTLPSEWQPGWPASSGPTTDVTPDAQCLDPSHAVMTGTELDLNLTATSETCGGGPGEGPPQTSTYTSALVSTNPGFTYTYGVAEAKIWLPSAANGSIADWPSFWATNSPWPLNGEDDILEGLSSGANGLACFHFHWGVSAAAELSDGGCGGGTYTGGWHTFASDWEPGSITYYYDGVQVGQLTSGITSSPMYLILGLGYGGGQGGPLTVPATQRVAYVRVWQH